MPWYAICLMCAVCLGGGILLGTICAERKLLSICRICRHRREDECRACVERGYPMLDEYDGEEPRL